eukprot:718557-Pelagomonas_calceolata.AAC.1
MGMECFELKWGRMLDVAVVPIIMHDFALSDSNTTLLYATPFIMEQTTPQSHKYFAYQDPAEEAQQVRISYHVALVIPHGLCELVQPYGGICKKVGGGGFQKHEGTREGSEAVCLAIKRSVQTVQMFMTEVSMRHEASKP